MLNLASIFDNFQTWLEQLGLTTDAANFLKIGSTIIFIILLAYIAHLIISKILIVSIHRIVKKSKTKWDDYLVKRKVIHRLAHLAPALIIYYASKLTLTDSPELLSVINTGIYIYLTLTIMITLDAFLSALHDIYLTLPISKERTIKGYIQVAKILIHSGGSILILSQLLGKDPTAIFASLGALAAVLILVFRDTILGFVSSIQLSANNMVKPGDWISMPSRNADGPVIEITVNTVKVRNWDKTISTIPTWALINESFQNWRGMEESKGRRIARSIYIDIKSIQFATDEMLTRFKKFKLIRDYINEKQKEIEEFNKKLGITDEDTVSRRRLTNVGIFRKYIEEYLARHPKLHPNEPPYITLVRHLQPTEKGLPIQIYVFSKEYSWGNYEKVQADIFDHVFAVIPEFELRVFQNPSGDDFRSLKQLTQGREET
ncbi:MAG: mechanosensitive ion channel family protein [Bacteroidales bacterium]